MNKFKVGDRVKVIKKGRSAASCRLFGKSGIVIVDAYGFGPSEEICNLDIEEDGRCGGFWNDELEKIGGSMSNYDRLKGRIEALENGWDKEADDIIKEIGCCFVFTLSQDIHYGTAKISISNRHKSKEPVFTKTQCERQSAFKKGLLWLLDHSDIKKDEKQEKIKELEGRMDEMAKEIKELKK